MSVANARIVDMKFTVGRDALGDAVAFVSRALPSRPVVPLLSGMLIEASAGGLTLSCFDYEISARGSIDADVATPGAPLVPRPLPPPITRSPRPPPAPLPPPPRTLHPP